MMQREPKFLSKSLYSLVIQLLVFEIFLGFIHMPLPMYTNILVMNPFQFVCFTALYLIF